MKQHTMPYNRTGHQRKEKKLKIKEKDWKQFCMRLIVLNVRNPFKVKRFQARSIGDIFLQFVQFKDMPYQLLPIDYIH